MSRRSRQRGVLLIVAIVLLVTVALLAATMSMIAGTSEGSAADNLRAAQALFLAESGQEYEARRMAQNVDWYRSSTDPTTSSGAIAFGAGTFTTSSTLSATRLRRRLALGTISAVCVYSIDRFPASGTIQVDDDIAVGGGAEFIRYTGTTASLPACGNLPALTGLTRGVQIAGTGPSTGLDHSRDDIAYPVTTLIDALAASATCVAPAQLRITDNSKFLDVGTISLDDGGTPGQAEDIAYASSSRSGGVMTLTGLTRLLLTNCFAWPGGGAATGAPVRVQLVNSSGNNTANNYDFEALASSVGVAGNAQRASNRVLHR